MRPTLTALSSFAAFTLASMPALAAAPEVERVIEARWHGLLTATADWTESGKVYIEEYLSLDVDGSDDITGSADAHFTLDGTRYDARYTVRGHYDGKDGVRLTASLDRGDSMPHGLRWCNSTSSLTIYRDADHDGHFLMKGTVNDDCGGTSDIEYTDRL